MVPYQGGRALASRRPWAARVGNPDGATGLFWHARFFLRGRAVREAADLWHHDTLASVRPLIVHMLAHDPSHIEFAFSTVDGGAQIADAIGKVSTLSYTAPSRGTPTRV